MVLTGRQWRDLKGIRWDKRESKRIRQRTHDEKLLVGFCPIRKRWVIARLVTATVEVKFGVKTIPTRETVPYIWKIWEDDDGSFLPIQDPRLCQYIRRCDLWRMGTAGYLQQYTDEEWKQEQRDRSESDDVYNMSKDLYSLIKPTADKMCGFVPRINTFQKHHYFQRSV